MSGRLPNVVADIDLLVLGDANPDLILLGGDWAGAGLVALTVLSHAIADYATGLKPTWPAGPVIGLGLYRQPVVDFVLEGVIITIGWVIYRGSLVESRRRSSPVVFMLITLLLLQLAASVSFAMFPGIRKC